MKRMLIFGLSASLVCHISWAGGTPGDYVQTGLIAQWDGIDNVGTGQHDPEARIWKDLKGSADVTLGEGDSVCEESGVILVDRRTFSGVPSASDTKPMTLEIAAVETINIGVFNQQSRLFFLDRRLCMSFDHRYSGGTFNVATAKGASTGACYFKNVLNETDAAQAGVLHSYSAVLGMNIAATPYYDGAVKTLGNNLNWNDGATGTADGSGYIGSNVFNPRFYSIRLYNRALTEAEIAVNVNVDKIRFGGADPSTLVWPDGYRFGAGGTECRVTAVAQGGGAVSVSGSSAGSTAEAWAEFGVPVTLTAVSSDAATFCYWATADGKLLSDTPTVQVAPDAPVTVFAVFAGEDESPCAPPFPPIVDGLILDVDASVASTVFTDADGIVTNWVSKVGTMAFGAEPSTGRLVPGFLDASQFNGRGAVVMGLDKDGKTTNSFMLARAVQPIPARTHMVVWTPLGKASNPGYSYGYSNGSGNDNASYNEGINFSPQNDWANTAFVSDSRAWLNEMYVRDTMFNGGLMRYGLPYTMTLDLSEALATSQNLTALRRQVLGSWRWYHSARNLPMAYAEVLNWSRRLSLAETRYMQCYLAVKWHPDKTAYETQKTVYEWTGAGDGTTWGDDANWKGGVAPSTNGVVVISAPEGAVNVLGEVSVDYLILRDAPSVAVQAGASLTIANLLSVKGTTAFSAAAGSRLSHALVHKWPGAAVSFAIDDATLVAETPSLGKCFRDNYEYGRPYPFHLQPHELQAGPVTGTGRFVVAVGGVHRLSPDYAFPDGLACTVTSGGLDLNGRNLSVTTLAGAGFVTNSAATRATVTVTGADRAEVRPALLAGVDLLVKDVDAATFAGQGRSDGTVAVSGSALAVEEDIRPDLLTNGIVWHVDAARSDTVFTNAAGRITKLYSCSPERMVFTKYGSLTPLYLPKDADGKPSFVFGCDDTGACDVNKPAALHGDIVVSNYTIVVAFKPFAKMPSNAWHGLVCCGGVRRYCDGKSDIGSRDWAGIKLGPSGTDSPTRIYVHTNDPAKDADKSRVYHNGACVRDDLAGFKNAITYRPETVQVVVAGLEAVADKTYGYNGIFNPCLGGILNLPVYNYGGMLYEAMAFDKLLSHEEMKELSAYLMRKWGADPLPDEGYEIDLPGAKDQLPVNGTLAVDGATVDLGGFTNHVAKLVTSGADSTITNGTLIPAAIDVKVVAKGKFARVSGDADWDISGAALSFRDVEPTSGKIIKTTGTVRGSFGSVDPAKLTDKVKGDGHAVKVSNAGLLIFVR